MWLACLPLAGSKKRQGGAHLATGFNKSSHTAWQGLFKMKKKIILGTVLAVVIFAALSLGIHLGRRGIRSIIVNKRTVMEMGRRAGFDMDNPDNFGRQVQKKYEELTPGQCRKVFHAILNIKEMPKPLKVLPPDLRVEAIDKTAQWLGKYRQGMTEEEREELRGKIRSPEGQEMVHRAKYGYFDGFSAQDRAEIAPIVDEILKILSEL